MKCVAAVEDGNSSLQETAAGVVAPSEESELESQGSDNIEALVSSDSEDEIDINIQFDEDEADDSYEDDTRDSADVVENDDAGSEICGAGSGDGSTGNGRSYSSSSGTYYSGSNQSGRGTGTGSSGSRSRTGSVESCSRSWSTASSASTGQVSVESHESAQDLFYRLMMGKDSAISSVEKKKNEDGSSISSIGSGDNDSSSKKPSSALTIDDGIIPPSPLSTSTTELLSVEDSSPIPSAENIDDQTALTLVTAVPAEHERSHHQTQRSPALLDPTTAKTAGWMSSSVVEKMKQNPNRRRVAGAGSAWRGLAGTKTPSPIPFSAPVPTSTSPSSRPSNVASNLLRARMVSEEFSALGRSVKVVDGDPNSASNTDGAAHPTGEAVSPVKLTSLLGEMNSPLPDKDSEHVVDPVPPATLEEAMHTVKSHDEMQPPLEDSHHAKGGHSDEERGSAIEGEGVAGGPQRDKRPSCEVVPPVEGHGATAKASEKAAAAAHGRSSPKGFFRFSTTLREGMDMLYRAAGTTVTTSNTTNTDINGSDRWDACNICGACILKVTSCL